MHSVQQISDFIHSLPFWKYQEIYSYWGEGACFAATPLERHHPRPRKGRARRPGVLQDLPLSLPAI